MRSGAALTLALVPIAAWAQVSMTVPITLIAVDSSPTPVIFASVGQGLMRSVDDGANYRPLYFRKAGQPQPVIHDLAIDPVNPKNVYVAVDLEEGGVLRSIDGGDTWTAGTGLPAGGARVDEVKVVGSSPKVLFARVDTNKIYKSANSGETWVKMGDAPIGITAWNFAPSEPNVMIAARLSSVYISNDEGVSWKFDRINGEEINTLQFEVPGFTTVWNLAFEPRNSQVVLMALASNAGPNGIFRSSNQGRGFAKVVPSGIPALEVFWDQTGGPWVFVTGPGGSFFRSGNRGANWQSLSIASKLAYATLAVDPKDPSRIWAGTNLGIYRTTLATATDRTPNWEQRSGLVKPTLTAPASDLVFNLIRGQQGQLELPIGVVETDQWQLPIQVSVTSGQPWLGIAGFVNTTPSNGRVLVNTGNLAPGTYTGSIRITSQFAFNDTITVPVKLTVKDPPADQPMTISTFTGLGTRANVGDNGPASSAAVGAVDSLAVDAQGNIFLSDISNHVVRKIAAGTGIITRVAGTTQPAFSGDGGLATLASFQSPKGLAVDAFGTLYVADSDNRRLRLVTTGGSASSVAELVAPPRGVAVDADGNRYVAIPLLHAVLQVTPDGKVKAFAGTGVSGFRGDDQDAQFARLSAPQDVAVDAAGNVYIADTENHRIRRVGKDGKIKTVAGSGNPGFQGDADLATTVALFQPAGVAVDAAGNIYIADTGNQRIRMARADGPMVTIAGTGAIGSGGDGGSARTAQFRSPVDVAVDADGNVYVADSLNFKVRKLTPPPLPTVSRDGIRNFADGSARFAPGSLFRIDGKNFSDGSTMSADAPWPAAIGGTSVSINGKPAPLTMVSAGQINGQIPYEVAPGEAQIQVTAIGLTGAEMTIAVTPAAPAILLFAGDRPVAQTAEGAMITAENPAVAGSVIRVMFTGFGAVDPAVGSGAPGDGVAKPVLPATVRVGDFDAELIDVTLAPGLVGVAQAQIRLPAEVPAGDQPLTIAMSGQTSNTAKLPVAAP